jgi:hypothetical protein
MLNVVISDVEPTWILYVKILNFFLGLVSMSFYVSSMVEQNADTKWTERL